MLASTNAPGARNALAALAFSFFALTAAQDNTTEPLSTFYSRPDLTPPALTCHIHEDGIAPGYIFIAPYGATQSGPYIYDKSCNLVWSGFGFAGPETSHDVQVCTYNGEDHLCFMQGNQMKGYARGHGLILDKSYTIVKSIEVGGSGVPSVDMHEFNMINDGASALVTAYMTIPYDLADFGITTGVGYLQDGTFQEVEVDTGKVLFEWRAIDHVPLNASYVLPNASDTSGTGLSPSSPWDWFHINSVDKSSYSDTYLISARSVSSLYNLNATDGSIIWTLSAGGAFTDFDCTNFNFSYQHDARFVSENTTHTVLSLYDNASNGFNQTSPESSAMVVALDHTTNKATMLTRITPPAEAGGIVSSSQGNTQLLPNGNFFNGWGNVDALSEHAADGTPLLYATWGAYPVMNYRAWTFNWTATPKTEPAVYAFARNATAAASTAVFVSWNGATDAVGWRFYGGDAPDALTQAIGTKDKEGFETAFSAQGFSKYVAVEALDAAGRVLSRSSPLKTFVPNQAYAELCSDVGCPEATSYSD
ncbi:arylsulfotransferase protein [Diplodia corticola]|uniref:Arylsulfotransferase protein n=1 Tax=Diplodia corticola TaxID=236234 RepID=A0A1J9QSV8_9PEZI|nr:arylsulfotransferase protein [Diplodia corticola]OJD31489.1 arylsulfotransferase protein [Diplodia corticola]